MKTSSYEGFTLIECLLVLLIMGIFITIPVIGIQKWREKNKVEMFLSQVERKIQETHQSAIVAGLNTKVSPESSKQSIKFENYFRGTKKYDYLYVGKL